MANKIILLRGLVRESGHWGDFPSELQKAFPDFQVECVDLPGCGVYYQEESPDTIEGMAQFVHERVELKDDANNMIVAISMGAMIATTWLKMHPNKFKAAVFINTSFRGISPFFKRLRVQSYPTILKAFATHSVPEREKYILSLSSNLKQNDQAIVDRWVQLANEHPVSRKNAVRQLVAASKFQAPFLPPSQPILLLTSDDQLVSTECSESIHQMWKTDIERHPSAGHDITVDDSAWVIEKITTWHQKRGL